MMAVPSKSKLSELQTIISRMPLEVCSVAALPELGLRWRDVAKTVRNNRLPMTSLSVARVLRCYAVQTIDEDQLEEIVPRLRLVLTATQTRTWHVINLVEPLDDSHVVVTSTYHIQTKLYKTLRGSKAAKGMRPEVQTIKLGSLVYISVQLVSEYRERAPLYIAQAPGVPVALVSSLGGSKLLMTCVEGLGYQSYTDAKLSGQDIQSLLRIIDDSCNQVADHLASTPVYAPMPVITKSGIDYTNDAYNENYVNNLIGPNPPLLTELNIKLSKRIDGLNRVVNLTVKLKSDDVAQTLKEWVKRRALSPTSDLFTIFHKLKSNRLTFDDNSE